MADETVSSQTVSGVIGAASSAASTAQPNTQQPTIGQPATRRKRDDGISLLAIYHFVLAIGFLMGTVALAIPATITAIVGIVEDPGALIATFILGLIAFVLMICCALVLATGYGLWTQKQWARMAALAMAVLSLFAFPLGTVIGGVTIWYLLKPEVAEQFV